MAELFNIKHEVDLSEYTSVVDVDGHLTAIAGAALAGTAKGLNCYINDGALEAYFCTGGVWKTLDGVY